MAEDIEHELVARTCNRCRKDIFDDPDIQYDPEFGAICHRCWHERNPSVYCFTCETGVTPDDIGGLGMK